jgi:hypothetical protein
MCLERIILGPFGLPQPDFIQQLFSLSSIQHYATQGKSNILICEFEYDEAQALSSLGTVPPLSQLSQLSHMSCLSEFSIQGKPCELGQISPWHGIWHSFQSPFNQPYDQKETVPMGFGFGTMVPNM